MLKLMTCKTSQMGYRERKWKYYEPYVLIYVFLENLSNEMSIWNDYT